MLYKCANCANVFCNVRVEKKKQEINAFGCSLISNDAVCHYFKRLEKTVLST